MGVAVITSRSAPGPFARRALRWPTPNRCCSSMTTSDRCLNATLSERTAWVPKSTSSSPDSSCAWMRSRSAAGVAPVRSAQDMPACESRGPVLSAYWRASTPVGAITQACVPLSAATASAQAATAVLPVPTSPSSRRFITRPPSHMSCRMSWNAASCSSLSENGRACLSAPRCSPAVWA